MGKSKAPPPPDYAAAATAQGAANLESAQFTAALNRPNQVDPNGTQTWSLKEGADPKNPQAGDWTVTNSLNNHQQALKNQQDRMSGTYADLAEGALGTIGTTMATKFDTSGLPQASALTNSGLTGMSTGPAVPTNRTSISADNMRDWGHVAGSTEDSRQRITDAMYARQTAMLDPQMKQQESDLTARLAAQGITDGSQAFSRATDDQARAKELAYAGARNDAITAGGAEESRIGLMNLNEANFNNATRGQQLGERSAVAGFNNNNLDTTFNQGMTSSQLQNAVRAQEFGERQAMTAANNTLHQNSVAEALMQRELGMNEANALRTGAQVGGMQFQAYGGAGQVQAAPIMQATTDGYNAQLAQVNADNSASAGMWSGLTSLGGAAIGKYSDRRLKRNIRRVGTHKLGIGLYDFDYVWGEASHGVMADEVRAVMPAAVMRGANGFDRVNYSMLEA